MAYVSASEVKAYGRIADAVDDAQLAIAIPAAQAAVDAYCQVRPGAFELAATATARTYRPDAWWELTVDPFGTLTGLVVKSDDDDTGTYETTWTISTDFIVEPANALADGAPLTRLRAVGSRAFPHCGVRPHSVEVTAKWGWPSTPAAVKTATLIQAFRLHVRRTSPLGFVTSPDLGAADRISAQVDPDVRVLLDPYRQAPFGVVL